MHAENGQETDDEEFDLYISKMINRIGGEDLDLA